VRGDAAERVEGIAVPRPRELLANLRDDQVPLFL
jgi:hypothetical protein